MMNEKMMRSGFWILNKFLMVPLIRMGLLPLFGTPFGGWVMLLTTTGRVTGKRRFAPVNYALSGGNVYCLAGFGERTHWYVNMKANPQVDVLLPSGPFAGHAEDVTDPDERMIIMRKILKNSGFATFVFGGINPFRMSDEQLDEATRDYCLVRIKPVGIAAGVSDPGGLLWVWWLVTLVVVGWLIAR